MFSKADFSDLKDFGVGHYTYTDAGTGCSVFVCPEGASCGVDVRGGGPATRETDLLKPENMVSEAQAVVISGGSAFGLEAACGVMENLASRQIGFHIANTYVPIVPGACLFDLLVGSPKWPTIKMGSIACDKAMNSLGQNPEVGNVGAGTGATVGKMGLPEQAMKSGFAYSGLRANDLVVIASVAVNACGNVLGEDKSWIAGPVGEDGQILDPLDASMNAMMKDMNHHTTNTTLGVITTNAILSKAQATKIAQISQDGYARAIYPVHTLNDGDTIFVMASNKVEAEIDLVGVMAANAMESAIRNAIFSAQGAYGLKSAQDLINS